jgi:DNA-binding LacI/PurR family transcriptional regulator
MKKKSTFRELARLAQVSPSTVSRVVSGSARVDREIEARVRDAAARLGIDLNRAGKSRIIVYLLGNRELLHPFQSRILAGAEEYCTAQGWELLFLSFHSSAGATAGQIQLPQILSRRSTVRGVILGGTNPAGLLLALQECGLPFSVLGNNVLSEWDPTRYDVVSSDDTEGARAMTNHLIAQGHRHIWYIGDQRFPWFARCHRGYCGAMADAGLEPHSSNVRSDGQELGYLGTKSALASGEPVTAIFAGHDEVAHGVYTALRDAGIQVPDEISVAGFNDTEGRLLHPALTTVREFPEEIGRHMAELVTTRIANPALPPRQISIATQLVRRESVARCTAPVPEPHVSPA